MFRRLLVEDWQRMLTLISFAIFAIAFLITLLRVRRLPREQIRHLENLPLENDSDENAR
jgi:archaellum biogenesis protein FlaJ (TadC family)